ncbi:glycoside hydrolase family 43 protein [Aquimarina gracilis]|uniref:Glycoside hydrolase family 43 protein n=1 Tax=Aquimarina gracilis TaxID=874422 RepID=A0ABU5ZRS5_9FLAO|nr:glycoside hydrolase family 43 protein [Aquimarina gracilis]MEB3344786.1 glycoside hydrolase family 43 protein [Aquimarina gracilis]
MSTIQNPILRGFNPDPSIVRVGEDYYIATSTFEWFPGVQIHHSRDLKNWRVIAQPLNRLSQLDLKGNPDSCGVWAPCLSYDDGVFYLVYSNVRSFDGIWKDTPNYLVTTTDIRGSWSDPIYLSSRGFDGSLFHDNDGKKYFLNMLVNHQQHKFFGGIELQEYDPKKQRLVGEVHYLHPGSSLGCTEGPHIFKKDDFYYLILAEGGTEYRHAMSIARSSSLLGPYELHPNTMILSSSENTTHPLQKAGHGDFVQTSDGKWYTVFLVGRPLTERGKCILGRETAIEEIEWKDNGWPYLKNGSKLPRIEVPEPNINEHSFNKSPIRDDFDAEELSFDFQSLRIPKNESWISLRERKGFLRLKGKESLTSTHTQALIARRVQHFDIEVSTAIEFYPDDILEMAGLVFYYNTGHYHYLHVTSNYKGTQKLLKVISSDHFEMTEQEQQIDVTGLSTIVLKGVLHHEELQFYYSIDQEQTFVPIGKVLDASILSDDYVRERDERYRPAFTGMFVGICCQDLGYNKKHADFDWFEYKEIHKK